MTATVDALADLRTRAAQYLQERIPVHLARLSWSDVELADHQRQALRETVAHAMVHSPFHARRLAGIDPSSLDPADLSALPVMTKADLMGHFDEVLTDRRVDRSMVEAALAAADSDPVPLPGGHLAMASGGSSGVRGVFVYSVEALVDYVLGMIRPSIARLLAFGGPPPGGVPMSMVAAGSAVHATRLVPAVVSGDMIRVTTVPATLPLTEIVARLNDQQPLLLQSYPSILANLAAERLAGRLTISPLAITSTSEPLDEAVRAIVVEAFGVEPSNQFGSSEGLLGTSEPGSSAITLATDLTLVELVDDRGHPVEPGQRAHAAYLTTLFNPVLPLIRYELTDQMLAIPGTTMMRVEVGGRSDDVLRWGTTSVHPHALRSVLVRTPEVSEYQIRQRPDGLEVDVVSPDGFSTDTLANQLRTVVAEAGLDAPVVQVRVVSLIERHAHSGKIRRVVPLSASSGKAR